MKIQILSVSVTTKTGKKAYQNAEVAYKNLDFGKVEAKNITEYSKVFKQVADSAPGQIYDVTTEKDNGGYWQWTTMTRTLDTEGTSAPTGAPPTSNSRAPANTAPRSNYETPEERAKKQVYIVRQSSITAAINILSVGAKTPPKKEDVVELAAYFTDFVFGKDTSSEKTDLFDLPSDIEVE